MCENFVALAIKPLFFLTKFCDILSFHYPGYQRFFSRAAGSFGVGRRPKPRAAKPREKPLVPRVVEAKNVTEFRKKK